MSMCRPPPLRRKFRTSGHGAYRRDMRVGPRTRAGIVVLASGLMLGLACGGEPEVTVVTAVGDEADPQRQIADAKRVAQTLGEPDPTLASTAAQADATFVPHPPQTKAEFEAVVKLIRSGPLDELEGAARNLAAADPAIWPQVKQAMLADRKDGKSQYRRLLAVIGGDVPNRYGHFDLHWKQAHGYKVKLSEDWFEDLVSLPRGKVSSAMRPIYRDCVLEAALLRAAASIGVEDEQKTPEVVDALLDAAYVHKGTFRDEVGRAVQRVGDPAIPQLLRRMVPPEEFEDDEESIPYRQAEYAEYNLDRMDRLAPGRAIAAVRDAPDLLADTLSAYGIAKLGEAPPHLLEYFDDPDPNIQAAARASFLAYVTGPPPKARRKKLRTLGGGTTRRSTLSYRSLALLAIRARLEAEAPDLLEEECRTVRENGSTDTHCVQQPQRLTRAYIELLDDKATAAQQATLAAALTTPDPDHGMSLLDSLLVQRADLGEPERVLPIVERAIDAARDDGNDARAAQLLRKGALLAANDSQRASRWRAEALLRESRVEGVSSRGRSMLLATAASIPLPEHGDAQLATEIEQARQEAIERGDSDEEPGGIWPALAIMLGALASLWMLGAPVRKRLYPEQG